jgi:hypothetical protein
MYQTPESGKKILALGLPTHTDKDYDTYLPLSLKCPQAYKAIGIRANDSITRRYSIKTFGALNDKKQTFYPIYDWSNDDLRKCLKENDCKLPIDYELFGRSFDSLQYQFIKPLQQYLPEDFERIKEIFPLIELEILRYEENEKST